MLTSLTIKAALTSIFVAAATAAALPLAVATASTGAKPAVSLPVITVRMNGKSISVTGALRSGGVEVVSKVTKEPQGIPVFIRLDPGVTMAEFLKALPSIGADQNNVYGIGTIVFSPQADRGISKAQVSLLPGRYVGLDVSSSGQPPLTTFTIGKASSPAALPRPGATIASIEFSFRGPGRLYDGELVRFANHGFLVHMIIGLRARNLRGARSIARLLRAGKDGRAQRLVTDSYGFVNVLTHGAYMQEVVRQRAGYWVLACFMDTQDGREHTQLGMERIIRIVK